MTTRTDDPGMRDVWCWALSWLRRPPVSDDKRRAQLALVEAIKERLRDQSTTADLDARYAADRRWCLELARARFPRRWPTLGVHACTAAAYGLRAVELLTGRSIDATAPLPPWLGEWALHA